LDMKRTFDEVVMSHASPTKAAQILENPFYEALSSSFAGTQEYMAMEKLGQLHAEARRSGRWDLIVVDTPPSRSALDFLDAPERLEDERVVAAGLLRLHGDRLGRIARERNLRRRLAAAHPRVPTTPVAALASDVHDLTTLREVGRLMAA